MFPLGPAIETDKPRILTGYEDLLWYDGPILFTGRNNEGVRVVGSAVDEEEGREWCFHACVSDIIYKMFTAQDMSYLELLRHAWDVFVVEHKEDGSHSIHQTKFGDIPEEYLPSEHSYLHTDAFAESSNQMQ